MVCRSLSEFPHRCDRLLSQVDIDLADPDEVFSMRPTGTTKAVMTAMPEDGPG